MKSLVLIMAVLIGASWTTKMSEGDVEKMPEFVGGQSALFAFMGEKVVYPEEAKKKNIEGTTFISFRVEATGDITNAEVKKSAHELLDKEALRVINLMPKWIPGEKEGKKVAVEMTLPVTFKLKS